MHEMKAGTRYFWLLQKLSRR